MSQIATQKNSSRASSSGSKNGVDRVKRPANCWMLFRASVATKREETFEDMPLTVLRECLKVECVNDLLSGERHTIAGGSTGWGKVAKIWWDMMSPEEKKVWEDKARVVKEEHQRMYPDYKYKPRRRGEEPEASVPASESTTPPVATPALTSTSLTEGESPGPSTPSPDLPPQSTSYYTHCSIAPPAHQSHRQGHFGPPLPVAEPPAMLQVPPMRSGANVYAGHDSSGLALDGWPIVYPSLAGEVASSKPVQ